MRLRAALAATLWLVTATVDGQSLPDVGAPDAMLAPDTDMDATEPQAPINKEQPGDYCGDGRVGGVEECDLGWNVATADCSDLGYENGGQWYCVDCVRDLSECGPPECGNGIVEAGESCDAELSCQYGPSTCVLCEACQLVEVQNPHCGDGILDRDYEACDGELSGAVSCESLGYGEGSVTCTGCELDPRSCDGSVCGDGWVTGTEECDLPEGPTECPYLESCTLCTDTCEQEHLPAPTCGDGLLHSTELCDDGASNVDDPRAACPRGELCSGCDRLCQLYGVRGPYCGDGVVDAPDETCDNGDDNILYGRSYLCPAWEPDCEPCSTSCAPPDWRMGRHPPSAPPDQRGCMTASRTMTTPWPVLLLGLALRRRHVRND